MLGKVRKSVALQDTAGSRRGAGLSRCDEIPNGIDARFRGQRDGVLPAEFESVVLLWIVRRGDHRAGGIAVVSDREIQLIGRREAKVDDIGAGGGGAARECREERLG